MENGSVHTKTPADQNSLQEADAATETSMHRARARHSSVSCYSLSIGPAREQYEQEQRGDQFARCFRGTTHFTPASWPTAIAGTLGD